MALVPTWLPPSREHWELVCAAWRFFPVVTGVQWLVDWYPQGKTSTASRLNLPGKWAWFGMEVPGVVTLLYLMATLPAQHGIAHLPWQNWAMAGLFTTHYLYRAVLAPLLLNPSMSPIHPVVAAAAAAFQLANATSLGGWLAAYGPVTPAAWSYRSTLSLALGAALWAAGLAGNVWHDDALRELRRRAAREQAATTQQQRDAGEEKAKTTSVDKVYLMPDRGLFRYMLYPHFVCEWVEWAGFWVFGGWGCVPARSFLLNEVATMWPRARQGWRWYVARFGREAVGSRGAVVPGWS